MRTPCVNTDPELSVGAGLADRPRPPRKGSVSRASASAAVALVLVLAPVLSAECDMEGEAAWYMEAEVEGRLGAGLSVPARAYPAPVRVPNGSSASGDSARRANGAYGPTPAPVVPALELRAAACPSDIVLDEAASVVVRMEGEAERSETG